jgi:CBS domain containing-hemolysin-like protein
MSTTRSAAFLYALAGKIPVVGDHFEHDGLDFSIAGVRGKRITQVILRPNRSGATQDAGAENEA